jgi:hypothetical protein
VENVENYRILACETCIEKEAKKFCHRTYRKHSEIYYYSSFAMLNYKRYLYISMS